MSEVMIQIENLSRRYGAITALDRINLEVHQGEVMGFLGPNGAGKTTAMRILAGLLAPSEGRIQVGGVDVLDNPVEARAQIGFLPENPPIYEEMTVREYLHYLASLRRVPSKQVRHAVDQAMVRCGLTAVAGRLLRNLSKGYRQRAGIAQAIVHNPKVVILDEPTVGLDPIQIREIRTLIKELGGEHSVLLSTHILPEVRMTCDRVTVIHKGRIVVQDSMEGLEQRGNQGTSWSMFCRKPIHAKDLQDIAGIGPARLENERWIFTVQESTDPIPALLRAAVEQNWDMRELSQISNSLEEIFVQLTEPRENQVTQ